MNAFLFILATIASIFSQLPMIVNTPMGDMLKATWLLPFILSLFTSKGIRLKDISLVVFFLICFSLYCLTMETITGVGYMGADFKNVAISSLVFLASYMTMQNKYGNNLYKSFPIVLLISGILMSLFIFVNYNLVDALSSSIYIFQAKNSMSTILTAVVVIAFFLYNPTTIIGKRIKIIFILIIILVIFLLRSRATLLGLFFAVFYYVTTIESRKVKAGMIIFLCLVVASVILVPSLSEIVIDQILYAGRDNTDVNVLSSNRVERIPELIDSIVKSPLIGNGNIYFDCMPLVVVAQYGILGSSIIFVFLITLFRKLYRYRKLNDVCLTAFVLYCVFLINSLFEAQAPFGPGIKCFLLWVMVGFAFSSVNSMKYQYQ